MKKILITALALLYILPAAARAYDWTTLGLSVVETGQVDGKVSTTLKDASGHTFVVVEAAPVTDSFAKKIIRYKDEFYGMTSITIDTLTFQVNEDSFDVILLPKTFVVDGKNLLEYLPSGMLFYYQNDMIYDFRMMIGSVFMKINGLWINEDALLRKIRQAASDPEAYIRRADPDYFLSKLDEFEGEMEVLKTEVFEAKYALVCLMNRNLFGFRPVSREFVNAVLQYKTENPSAGLEEISKAFTEQGMRFSQKELKLVLNVFFNEF